MPVISNLGADIIAGDFLTSRKGSGAMAVCQVVNFIFPHSLKVVWWEEPDNAPPLDPLLFPNLQRSQFVELAPGDSSTILSNDVHDIAFVFRAETLEHIWTDLAGMSRVFFTRHLDHVPYSCHVVESYPCRLWFSLLNLKEKLTKMTSSKRQMQLCKNSMTTMLSLEAWKYLSRFFHVIHFQKFQTKVQQFSDLSLLSKSSVKHCQMIRIMNPTDVATARGLFGITFGIGSRNVPPRKGRPRKVLEMGDIVNIVQPPAEVVTGKFKEFTSEQRIDFVYEESCRSLSIRIVYSDVRAESDIVSATLKFPTLRVEGTPLDDNPPQRRRKVKPVPCATTFIHNDKFFSVTQSDGTRVFAVCDDNGEELVFDNDELWQIILDNIM
jgi:hypothetical protein